MTDELHTSYRSISPRPFSVQYLSSIVGHLVFSRPLSVIFSLCPSYVFAPGLVFACHSHIHGSFSSRSPQSVCFLSLHITYIDLLILSVFSTIRRRLNGFSYTSVKHFIFHRSYLLHSLPVLFCLANTCSAPFCQHSHNPDVSHYHTMPYRH